MQAAVLDAEFKDTAGGAGCRRNAAQRVTSVTCCYVPGAREGRGNPNTVRSAAAAA